MQLHTHRKWLKPLALAGLMAGSYAAQSQHPTMTPKADLIIVNADVYTVDPNTPRAQAIAVKDKRIVFVGDNAGIAAYTNDNTRVIDANGRFVMPGIIDSHTHLSYTPDPDFMDLTEANSPETFRQMIRDYAENHPERAWLVGGRWQYGTHPDGLPTWRDLEGLSGGRPIMITSYDGHTTYLNKPAMNALGIKANTHKVPFGTIVRGENGTPTGIFKGSLNITEEEADALYSILPEPDPALVHTWFKGYLDEATSNGITTIIEPQNGFDDFAKWDRVQQDGDLNAHVHMAMFHPPGTPAEDVAAYAAIRDERANDHQIHVPAIKLYIDDVIETHTAAMLAPYSDQGHNKGDTFFKPDAFKKLVANLDAQGFQLFIHAIGDRGIQVALDALEYANNTNGPKDRRHQLVHVEVLHPDDIPRFGELGVIADMQPRHATIGGGDIWRVAVGESRSRYAFPWRSLLDSGATIAFASDWDVAVMSPFAGMHAAITRQDTQEGYIEPWIPEERITIEEAIYAYTMGGAYANFMDDSRGSITVGKMADMIILSNNLTKISATSVLDVTVDKTIFEGQVVYETPYDQ